nr:uncharacterized protein LOC119184730 [Rhipicephalus microplus]
MTAFHAGLLTQDAMLLIKHQVLDGYSRDTKALLGLDLEKVFDNIKHEFILETVAKPELRPRLYNYIKPFLSGRKARLGIGNFFSEDVPLGRRGTPQGSVVSPVLFNLCMIRLSKSLASVDSIKHTIYPDDITIWCVCGSEGWVQDALQGAVAEVESYLRQTGLRCSPAKSELLLYRK